MIKALAILSFLLIVTPAHIFSQSVKNDDYSFRIQKGTRVRRGSNNIWTIPATLTNLSKDTLKYFSAVCAWPEFYFVDNEKIAMLKPVCEQYSKLVLKLAPGRSTTSNISLLVTPTFDTSFLTFKIGFNLIRANKPISQFNLKEVLIEENLTWSNAIKIQN